MIASSALAVFLLRERTPSGRLDPAPPTTAVRVPVEAAPVGDDWRVRNPTSDVWTQCHGSVAGKTVTIPEIGPGSTVTVSAGAFEPPLTQRDIYAAFELSCVRRTAASPAPQPP